MGRTSDEEGETSTKVCESDDSVDRPLKKARYVWQIKGKYHLKKPGDDSDSSKTFVPQTSAAALCEVDARSCPVCFKPVCSCDHKVISACSGILKQPGPSLGAEVKNSAKLPEDRYSGVALQNDSGGKQLKSTTHSSACGVAQLPAVKTSARYARVFNSWQLRKWQARQVARCFVDNTINRVLEDMGFVPLPVGADELLGEEQPATEGLEDEAVLMAIHSHGLQRSDTAANDRALLPIACACSCVQRVSAVEMPSLDPFHQRLGTWHRLEFEQLSTMDLHNLSGPFDARGQDLSHVLGKMSEAPLGMSSSSESSDGVDSGPEDIPMNCVEGPESKVQPEDRETGSCDHSDFLDKAVAVAIQKKGLSTLSCLEFG